ncbi:hypothetical protein HKCCE3408_05690 [Rhodobacterales bacterium HKCCE3408]|nr:hypothetical protein [Rhodobacterales bacterium HKCCE3408]
MTKPKISIPQRFPAIFELARDEQNWLIFAIGKPDPETGKRGKRPIGDKPYIWINRDKAAHMTLAHAMKYLSQIPKFFTLDEINERAEKRRQEAIAAGKKPPPPIEVEAYTIGYFAREGSALVALDFDNVVGPDRFIDDLEIGGMVEETGAYVEISSSGTGLRVFMPRAGGDEAHHAGEKRDAGGFVSSKGSACAITFNTIADGTERDQPLFDLMVERRGAAPDHEAPDTGTIEDQVLDHGRTEFETFRDIVAHVANDARFDEVGDWIGMIRGAKEYFAVVDPGCLDELRELLEEWSESHPTIEHDVDKFSEVWSRRTPSGAKTGLGSWKHFAREGGWTPGDERPVEAEEDGSLPVPVGIVRTKQEAKARFVWAGDRLRDRFDRRFLDRGNAGLLNTVQRAFVTESKGKVTPWAADKVVAYMRTFGTAFARAELMPGKPEVVDDVLNLWQAFPEFPEATEEDVALYLEHARHLLGEDAETFLDWLAFVLQHPGEKAGFAPVIVGGHGFGKDTLLAPLVKAFGPHARANLRLAEFGHTHNGWIEDKLLLVVNETALLGRDKAEVGETLKTYIAAPPDTIPLRSMGRDTVEIKNQLNMVFVSNHIDGLHIDPGERRYWVKRVEVEEPPRPAYFEKLWGWLDAGGAEAVAGYLMNRPHTRVRPRMNAPASPDLRAAIEGGLPACSEAVLDFVQSKRWVSTKQIKAHLAQVAFDADTRHRVPSDKAVNTVLAHAGFRRLDRITVGTGERKENHVVYVVRMGSSPLRDEIASALAEGEEAVARSQRLLTLVGEAGPKGEAAK